MQGAAGVTVIWGCAQLFTGALLLDVFWRAALWWIAPGAWVQGLWVPGMAKYLL